MFGTHPSSESAQSRRERFRPAIRSIRRSRRGRRSWTAELLEPRTLLSTFTVNSLGDTGAGSGTSGDLRFCITQADATTGANTINFSVTGTITLKSALPDLSNTTGLMDIEGPGAASLTVARSSAVGTPRFRILTIDAGATVDLVGLTITGGSVNGDNGDNGGGINNSGTLTLTNSIVSNNKVTTTSINGFGGGICNSGTLTVTNSTIADNNSAFGVGITNGSGRSVGTMTLANCAILDNTGGGAVGIESIGTMTLTNCTIAYNSVTDGSPFSNVCSIAIAGIGTVTNCTIAYNSAPGGVSGNSGAGIVDVDHSTLTVTNSTIANNSGGNNGGGIYNQFGSVTLTNSTIAYNSVDVGSVGGGGILNDNGTVMLDNTIVALNTRGTAASDIAGSTVASASAYNLIGTGGSGGLVNGVNGNQVGVAVPGLDALADNGGPTQTIALLSGSPAIDMGSNTLAVDPEGNSLTTDQRGPGFARIVNGTVDIGAFEVQNANAPAVTLEPADQIVAAGATAGFTATANGTPAPTVQWQLSSDGGGTFGDISGATSDTYSFTAAAGQDGNEYRAVFTNSFGSATTTAATLTIATAPVVTTNPSDQTVGAGNTATFTAAASGQPAPTAQWEVSSDGGQTYSNIGGATSSTLSFTATAAQNGDLYRVRFTNPLGSVMTTAARLTVQQPATVTAAAVHWGTQLSPPLVTQSDGLRLLPAGRNTDMPWLGINQLQIALDQTESLASGDITVTSAVGVNYGPVTVSGSGTSYTITLAQPVNTADRVTITIGNALITTFTRRLDVLPGDFNDDGVVNSQDLVDVRNEWLGVNGATATIFGDLNGDGVVNINDYNVVRAALGTTLPTVAPPAAALVVTAPGAPSGETARIAAVPTAAGSSVLPAADSGSPGARVSLGALVITPSASATTSTPPAQTVTISVSVHGGKAARRAAAAEARSMKRAEIRLANREHRLSLELQRSPGHAHGSERTRR